MTNRAPGTWYIAPFDDRADEYAAGYDDNSFLSLDEAEEAIESIVEAVGGSWVAVQRPKVTQ